MEQNWSARLRQGDEDALCEIIRQRTGYVSTILRNFSRSTLPPEDLEELSADVFLRLWRSRDKLKDGADLSPYLAAIARNCMKNYFRTQGKQPPVRQSYEDLLLSDKSDLCGDAETTEAIACLIRALDKLEEAGPLSGDTLLLLWRKDLSIGKSLRSDRHCCPAQTPPKQRKTPEIYDRKGF